MEHAIIDLFADEALPPYEQRRKDVILFVLRRIHIVLQSLTVHWNNVCHFHAQEAL